MIVYHRQEAVCNIVYRYRVERARAISRVRERCCH